MGWEPSNDIWIDEKRIHPLVLILVDEGLLDINVPWLDTCEIASAVWSRFGFWGYGVIHAMYGDARKYQYTPYVEGYVAGQELLKALFYKRQV